MSELMELEFELMIEELAENGETVNMKSVELAKMYINNLPKDVHEPEVCCDPDGDVHLDWGCGTKKYVNIVVTDHNTLIIGTCTPRGMIYEPVRGVGEKIPNWIVAKIRECD